jgi:predicted ATPase
MSQASATLIASIPNPQTEMIMGERARTSLIGRDEQLERLMARLAFALAGHGSTVLLAGEAGVGKTRLAQEFQGFVGHIDCLCLSASCQPGDPEYQPFREVFEQCAQVVPGLKGDPAFIRFLDAGPTTKEGKEKPSPTFNKSEREKERPTIDQGQPLFDAVAILRTTSGSTPLTIRIDDLHLADAKTIQMLHFLARSLGSIKVLLVAIYNDDELFDRTEIPHPLVEVVRIMKREGVCEEIYLPPLTRSEMGAALEGRFGSRFDQGALDSIYEECGGNPRIAVELAQEAVRVKSIRSINGLMTLQNKDRLSISASLRSWIARKIEALSSQQKEVLECAALLGDSFHVDDIAMMLGQERLGVLEKLEVAVQEHRLYVESSNSYSFRWGVLRHVALESIPGSRKALLLSCLGAALA